MSPWVLPWYAPPSDDHAAPPGVRAGHAKGELVGFAPGAHEEADGQRLREHRGEPLGIPEDGGMQVARVRVEDRHLPRSRGDDPRMSVADVRDVVDHVEKRPARLVEEVRARAAHDLEGRAVREREIGAEKAPTRVEQAGGAIPIRRRAEIGPREIDAQQRARVRRERPPDLSLARRADAVELAVPVQHVRHDLEVDVRRPVAVSGRRADRAHALPPRDLLARRQRLEAVGGQVAVQRVEAGRALRRMLEDDGRSVVVARGVVMDGVHPAGQRSVHGRAGLHEDVQSDVHGAALRVLGAL